jgi:hypothetical protein
MNVLPLYSGHSENVGSPSLRNAVNNLPGYTASHASHRHRHDNLTYANIEGCLLEQPCAYVHLAKNEYNAHYSRDILYFREQFYFTDCQDATLNFVASVPTSKVCAPAILGL